MRIGSSVIAITCAALLMVSRSADAQWYVAGYLGANHTTPATVTIDQPAVGTSLEFQDVTFVARPFESPQYYGFRAGYMFGERRRWGAEFEWVHPKLYADTSRHVRVQGRSGGGSIDTTTTMDAVVQRYAMSHGMNFALFNLVTRMPITTASDGFASRVTLTARGGGGFMLPHAETTVSEQSLEQYEVAGFGFQLAGGIDVHLTGRLSATLDYKFGLARPEITIVDGTGSTSANVHQIAFGLAFGIARLRSK
jgi:opacity protein-like surface antigen